MQNQVDKLRAQPDRITIAEDKVTMSAEAARRVAAMIRKNNAYGKKTVLGLATGSTPEDMYAELVRMHQEEGLDFSKVVTFNLDEYWPIDPDHEKSYHRYMNEKLFDHININRKNIHIPDGSDCTSQDSEQRCADYEKAIRDAGGIDLQILGIGVNGHIGFNEPKDLENSHWSQLRTRKVDLSASTIEANELQNSRIKSAISMGIGTIMDAKQILLLANGENKSKIIGDVFGHTEASPSIATFKQTKVNTAIPAGILAADPRCELIVDQKAAGHLKAEAIEKLNGNCLLGM